MRVGRNVSAAGVVHAAVAVAMVCAAGADARAEEPVGPAGAALESELASFAALDLVAARLSRPFDVREEAAAAAALGARAPAAGAEALGASPRDRVLLARALGLADAARWTARAIWRERRPGRTARAAEDEATAAVAAAYLLEAAARHPALGWYLVRLATFLATSREPGAAALVKRLRGGAAGSLRESIVRYLHRPKAVPVASVLPRG